MGGRGWPFLSDSPANSCLSEVMTRVVDVQRVCSPDRQQMLLRRMKMGHRVRPSSWVLASKAYREVKRR